MKRTLIITISITILFIITITCVGVYFIHTPEYTLVKIIKDVNESGIDGLQSYLTEEAQKTVDMVSAITESEFTSSIMGLFNKNDYISILKSEIQEIQWDIEDIMKSNKNAIVILAFNYDSRLIGTIEIFMIHGEDGWKIDSLGFPKFDQVNW